MRRALLLGFLTIAASVGGCGGGESTPSPAPVATEVLFPPLSPEAVAERMKRLENPTGEDGPSDNAPIGSRDEFNQPKALAGSPDDALDDLAKLAPASVEPELLRLARTHASFVVRCRAATVLVERRHPDASALVARLCESSIPAERHAAWWLADAVCARGMVPPIATSVALDRLEAERDDRLRTDIIGYLGGTGDRAAVPALEEHLAGLRTRFLEWKASDLARKDRIALVRLRSEDPCADLLAIVEDRTADLELRRAALDAAREFENRDRLLGIHLPRLIALYARETDPDLLDQCLTTLRESRAPGVTQALYHHAAVWAPHFKTPPEYLLRCLNRRLGTNYRTLDEVRTHPVK